MCGHITQLAIVEPETSSIGGIEYHSIHGGDSCRLIDNSSVVDGSASGTPDPSRITFSV